MATAEVLSRDSFEELRLTNYNAEVAEVIRTHADLLRMRVRPDRGIPHFLAGQHTVLGLGSWESRVANVQPEPPPARPHLIKRAYSVSCRLLDDEGRLARVARSDFLEFYITLVRQTDGAAPALTPRLFALQEGSRIFCSLRFHGHYTLAGVARDSNVVFAATGTGEAPHNAMLSELLATGHRGRIVSVTCVRHKADLTYLPMHATLQQQFANYRYLPLTTREAENVDPSHPAFMGRRYLQDYFDSGDFERETGLPLDPAHTHVFLCGNPDMIGVPRHTHNQGQRYPQLRGMVEVLERRGFCVDKPHEPANLHFEKYW